MCRGRKKDIEAPKVQTIYFPWVILLGFVHQGLHQIVIKNIHVWLSVSASGKKEQTVQEDYKDAVRSCRKKIRRPKDLLKLNLTTAIKDNKKCSYKYISKKRRVKENLVLDVQENREIKNEELPSLPQSLIMRPLVPRYPTPWAGRERQGAEWSSHNPWTKGQWTAVKLSPTQVHGAGWESPRSTEGAVEQLISSV